MIDPFLLLTLSGSAIGIAFGFVVLAPKRSVHPIRARRRRAVGIPTALTLAVGTAGAALLADAALIIAWWRWAVALFSAALLYAAVVFLARRWWKAVAVGLIAIPIVPALGAWMSFPFSVPSPSRSCPAPELVIHENGTSRSDESTLALVRIDPPREETESPAEAAMAVRILPVVDLGAGTDESAEPGPGGIWQPVGRAVSGDTLGIDVTLEEYLPPLWWFPAAERVTELSIRIGEERTSLSAAEDRIPALDRYGPLAG
ncbi:MAG: hypothetical protein ACOCU4_09615 [Alkalispirochaeta sp.]